MVSVRISWWTFTKFCLALCFVDTIVYERLDRSCKPLMAKTMQHLNVSV